VVLEDVRLDPSAPLTVDGRSLHTTGRVIAVPYFTWGNRGAGPMRVWVPTHSG
jgi:DUF1680 family protein